MIPLSHHLAGDAALDLPNNDPSDDSGTKHEPDAPKRASEAGVSKARRTRWEIPLGVLTVAALVLAYIWRTDEAMRQKQVLGTLAVAGVSAAAVLAWAFIFSGFTSAVRQRVFAALLAVGVAAPIFFEIEGVDGNLVPIVRYRFAAAPKLPEPEPQPATPLDDNKTAKGDAPDFGGKSDGQEQGDGAAAGDGELPPSNKATEPLPAVDKQGPDEPAKQQALKLKMAWKPAPPLPPPSGVVLDGAADSPQFMGPNRNGVLADPGLATDWSSRPPKLIWRQAIGEAWSGVSVIGQRFITQEQRGDDEAVVCYELATGKPLWIHRDATRYDTTLGGVGPRSTPTVSGHRVFTLGATGILNCLDLATGRKVWSKQTYEDFGATPTQWGEAASPLVDGLLVILNVGGDNGRSLVALHRKTGDLLWSAGESKQSYSSPFIATVAGERQIVILNQFDVTGHDAATGAVRWEAPFAGPHPKVAMPLVMPGVTGDGKADPAGSRIFVSASYGVGCALYAVKRVTPATLQEDATPTFDADRLWKNIRMKVKFSNVVLHDGHIYGLDDGRMVCMNADSGRRMWKSGGTFSYGHGHTLMLSPNPQDSQGEPDAPLLLVSCENGEVALLRADSKEHRELTRFKALDGKTWNPPTLAGRYLLIRNHREIACYELPLR